MKIKNDTAYNRRYIIRRIMAKGYDNDEAIRMTDHIFLEYNPLGRSINSMIDTILPKDEKSC